MWFNARIDASGREMVVLLLDNFTAHACPVEALEKDHLIPHLHIIWLPPNTTSQFQPMDQGIIRTWKAHYKRTMMRYIIQEIERNVEGGSNPYEFMIMLHAIQWSVGAWVSVKSSTLQHCFSISVVKIYGPFLPGQSRQDALIIADDVTIVEDEVFDCIQVAHPTLHMARATLTALFITPAEEIVENSGEDIDSRILAGYQLAEEEEED